MLTALSCLTLEVYYRYLPLYQVEAKEKSAAAPAGPQGRTEVQSLNTAIEAFRQQLGTYPPRGDPKELERDIAIMFPRWADYRADFKAAGLDLAKLDGSRALVFWLGGMRDTHAKGNRACRCCGLSANPLHPLEDNVAQPSRIGPFYTFDPKRLVEAEGGWLEYLVEAPPDGKPKPVQYDGKKVFLPGLESDDPRG